MKKIVYDKSHAAELLPLLAAIGTEIQERTETLERLEHRIEAESGKTVSGVDVRDFIAEAANHRRGLRLAKQELEKLGCSVVGMEPITFRIPGRTGQARRSFVWQAGEVMK